MSRQGVLSVDEPNTTRTRKFNQGAALIDQCHTGDFAACWRLSTDPNIDKTVRVTLGPSALGVAGQPQCFTQLFTAPDAKPLISPGFSETLRNGAGECGIGNQSGERRRIPRASGNLRLMERAQLLRLLLASLPSWDGFFVITSTGWNNVQLTRVPHV